MEERPITADPDARDEVRRLPLGEDLTIESMPALNSAGVQLAVTLHLRKDDFPCQVLALYEDGNGHPRMLVSVPWSERNIWLYLHAYDARVLPSAPEGSVVFDVSQTPLHNASLRSVHFLTDAELSSIAALRKQS